MSYPATPSNTDLNTLAKQFHANAVALNAKEITADEMRASNRELRGALSDDVWMRVKARALSQF